MQSNFEIDLILTMLFNVKRNTRTYATFLIGIIYLPERTYSVELWEYCVDEHQGRSHLDSDLLSVHRYSKILDFILPGPSCRMGKINALRRDFLFFSH